MTGHEGRIGRYTAALADSFMEVAGVRAGQRALDVGCGSGALTEPLAASEPRLSPGWIPTGTSSL